MFARVDMTHDTVAEADAKMRRLRPDMVSFRLIVLQFIRDYWAKWGHSPSYGEIAAACQCGKTRARDAAKSLARDGLIIRTPGPRGLALPDDEAEAIRTLRALGWQVEAGLTRVKPPVGRPHFTLLPPPTLRYPPHERGSSDGDSDDDSGVGDHS